jgi:transposase
MKKYTINEFRTAYPDDDACLDRIFQLRYNGLVCPKCEGTKPFTRVKDRRSYQCPGCGFQIYPTQGTVFEKTTTPLTHWFYAIYLQTTTRNGVAAKELERQLDVCYKTALRMAHQIKKLMSSQIDEPFTGVISMDETFVGGLNKNRHADKKIRNAQGRSPKDKTPVFVMINLSGKVKAFVVKNTSGEVLLPIVAANVKKDRCILVTDELMSYTPLAKEYMHVTVCHGIGEYARGAFHVNTPESFNACLKRTIKGTHIHVSVKHLQKYVDEVAFRWMHSKNQDQMFDTILQNVV